MEDCHIELGVMAHRPQLFHENLLLIRIINMSALDHETSTYDMLAITGKIHVLRELVGGCQISLKKIYLAKHYKILAFAIENIAPGEIV